MKALLLVILAALVLSFPHHPATAGTGPAEAATTSVTSAGPVQASFDCASASSEVEKLVCSDAELAALDRRLADEYASASLAPDADPNLTALQRGWIKGRDDCWKAEDKRLCVQEEYLTRLVQLQISSGAVMAAKPVEFVCNDNAKPFFMAYYNELDPPAALITYGDDQAIIFPQVAASGARYGRTGIEFWEHHGTASADFYGIKLECTPVP